MLNFKMNFFRSCVYAVLGWFFLGMVFAPGAVAQHDPRAPEPKPDSPKLGGAALIKYGSSPRLPYDTWVYMNYRVENHSRGTENLDLTVVPEGHDNAIFQQNVRVGAEARIQGRMLITTNNVENYELLLTDRRGANLGKDQFPSRLLSGSQESIIVLNDNLDYTGPSGLRFHDDLPHDMQVSYLGAEEMPEHWAAYGRPVAVLLSKVDFARITQMQYNALLDFVQRGGSLLFVDPAALLRTADTPLRELLPVKPLRMRVIEDFPELDAWGAAYHKRLLERRLVPVRRTPIQWPEGTLLLEFEVLGDGVTTLWHREFPVLHWQRHGLGRVGVSAIDPCLDEIKTATAFIPVWKHLLSWCYIVSPFSEQNPDREPARRALQLLTGFTIPSATLVQGILIAYLALVALILGVGIVMRRQAHAWVLVAGLGVVMTCGIFYIAFQQVAKQVERTAAIINLETRMPARRTTEKIISLFSRTDGRPTFSAKDYRSLFRRLGSNRGGFFAAERSIAGEILRISRNDGISSLPDLNIQALRPRRIVALSAQEDINEARTMPRPVLRLGSRQPVLEEFSVPGDIPAGQVDAYLLFERGFLRSRVRDGRTSGLIQTGDGVLQLNTTITEIENLFNNSTLPRPAMVLIYAYEPARDSELFDFGGFQTHGYTLDFLPLHITAPERDVLVPAEMIIVEPARHSGRTLRWQNEWSKLTLRDQANYYDLSVKIPAPVADMQITTITVDIEISNPGGNVQFEMAACPQDVYPEDVRKIRAAGGALERRWESAVPASQSARSKFVFQNIPDDALLSRGNGMFSILLKVSPRTVITDPVDAARANVWQINSVKASVSGRLPEAAGEQRKF